MKLKTYRARTMADAFTEVKNDLGAAAVILHTRTFKTGGLFGLGAKAMVEVIASSDANVVGRPGARGRTKPQEQLRTSAGRPRPAGVAAARAYAGATAGVGSGAPATEPVGATALAEPPAEHADRTPEPSAVTDDVRAMRLPVRQRRGSTADPLDGVRLAATPARTAPARVAACTQENVSASGVVEQELRALKLMVGQALCGTRTAGTTPEHLLKYYVTLIESQVAREVADDIVGAVRDELTHTELADEPTVRQALLSKLASMVPVCENAGAPVRAPDGRPRTIALVGPTGVGKTTTIAKLAACYKLRQGRKVGLVTSDTYRIAAVDQLRSYANIISLPLKVALTPAEMKAACESLSDCDVVLIDTAGRSQHDGARVEELRRFIDAARPHETHLVLSTTSSDPVLRQAVGRFGALSPNRVIFTKLDEAVQCGVIINVARELEAKLSYLTTGQEVPDDLEPSRADRIARLVLQPEGVGA